MTNFTIYLVFLSSLLILNSCRKTPPQITEEAVYDKIDTYSDETITPNIIANTPYVVKFKLQTNCHLNYYMIISTATNIQAVGTKDTITYSGTSLKIPIRTNQLDSVKIIFKPSDSDQPIINFKRDKIAFN